MDTDWYDLIAREVRTRRRCDDDGTVWLLFLDEGRRPTIGAVFPPATGIGAPEYDGLARMIDDIDPPGVVVVVPRFDGVPQVVDWRFWEELRARVVVTSCELVDLVVVGPRAWWALVGGRPDRAA